MILRHSSRACRSLAAVVVRESLDNSLRNRVNVDVPIEEICRAKGIRNIVRTPMQVEGFLSKDVGGLTIVVNSDSSASRQRFTIAHELGHVLLSQFEGKPIERKCRALNFSDDEEILVDMIAAEILMPSDEISKLVRSLPKNWEAIEYLVWNYRVSYTAALRRLLGLECVLGVWITGNEATCDSMSAWCSDSICQILNDYDIWKAFCREPIERKSYSIDVLVRGPFARVERGRLRGHLKYMERMGARRPTQQLPKNCWILAWTERDRPMVQLRLDFGLDFG